jgi:hypothetical protein
MTTAAAPTLQATSAQQVPPTAAARLGVKRSASTAAVNPDQCDHTKSAKARSVSAAVSPPAAAATTTATTTTTTNIANKSAADGVKKTPPAPNSAIAATSAAGAESSNHMRLTNNNNANATNSSGSFSSSPSAAGHVRETRSDVGTVAGWQTKENVDHRVHSVSAWNSSDDVIINDVG